MMWINGDRYFGILDDDGTLGFSRRAGEMHCYLLHVYIIILRFGTVCYNLLSCATVCVS